MGAQELQKNQTCFAPKKFAMTPKKLQNFKI